MAGTEGLFVFAANAVPELNKVSHFGTLPSVTDMIVRVPTPLDCILAECYKKTMGNRRERSTLAYGKANWAMRFHKATIAPIQNVVADPADRSSCGP